MREHQALCSEFSTSAPPPICYPRPAHTPSLEKNLTCLLSGLAPLAWKLLTSSSYWHSLYIVPSPTQIISAAEMLITMSNILILALISFLKTFIYFKERVWGAGGQGGGGGGGGEGGAEGETQADSLLNIEPDTGLSLMTLSSDLSQGQESDASLNEPPQCPQH